MIYSILDFDFDEYEIPFYDDYKLPYQLGYHLPRAFDQLVLEGRENKIVAELASELLQRAAVLKGIRRPRGALLSQEVVYVRIRKGVEVICPKIFHLGADHVSDETVVPYRVSTPQRPPGSAIHRRGLSVGK